MKSRGPSAFSGGVVTETHPEPHPHATLFPLLDGPEFDALVEDIRQHGLQQAIVVYRGKGQEGNQVLDGRNRLRACTEAGVEPRYTTFEGTDDEALAYVLSSNLHRRHLTTCQRAVLALQLLPGERDRARDRMLAGQAKGDPHQGSDGGGGGQALDLAGKRVGISRDSVWKATKIAESALDVVEAMRDGTIRSMAEAERLAGFPEERRQRVLAKMRETGCRLRDADTASTIWNRRGPPEWFTPPDLLATVRAALGGPIDLDPASCKEAQELVQARRFMTKADDGLQQPWEAERLWLNPPFGTVGDKTSVISIWLEKLFAEVEAGRVSSALVLTRAGVETVWFEKWLWDCPVCFLRRRPKFVPGPMHNGTRPNTAISIAGVGAIDLDRFISGFRPWGQVVVPRGHGTSAPVP